MTFQDFDAARRERQRALEPIRFRLGGKDFTCLSQPVLSDIFALALAPEPRKLDGTPELAGVMAVTEFVDSLLVNDRQRRRFKRVLRNRTEVIDGDSIIELGYWLVEQYTGRPFLPSTESSDGRRNDGETSSTRFDPEPSPT